MSGETFEDPLAIEEIAGKGIIRLGNASAYQGHRCDPSFISDFAMQPSHFSTSIMLSLLQSLGFARTVA